MVRDCFRCVVHLKFNSFDQHQVYCGFANISDKYVKFQVEQFFKVLRSRLVFRIPAALLWPISVYIVWLT